MVVCFVVHLSCLIFSLQNCFGGIHLAVGNDITPVEFVRYI